MKVFVYGIFCDPATRHSILGRDIETGYFELKGYQIGIHSGCGFNTLQKAAKFSAEGQTFEATPEDLLVMDKVEGVESGLYRRVEEQGVIFYLE
jgi:gamma-glutamylcyclotransferase (GGCT)/AIG2-like uncharacterized protein YtfP